MLHPIFLYIKHTPEDEEEEMNGSRRDKDRYESLHTMKRTKRRTKVTMKWSNRELQRGLIRSRGLVADDLSDVIAPQYPHLNMGAKHGSVNCKLHPQHVVSHFPPSFPCPSTRTCAFTHH